VEPASKPFVLRLKLFLLGFLGILLTNIALGQNTFVQLPLPHKHIDKFSIIADDAGNVCVQFFRKPYLYFYLINANGEVVEEIKEARRKEPEILFSRFTKNNFIFYYKPRKVKRHGHIAAFIIDKKTRDFKEFTGFEALKNSREEILRYLSDQKNGYVMIGNNKTQEISILKFTGETKLERKTFIYTPPLSYQLLANSNVFTLDDRYIRKSTYLYHFGNKIYLENDNIYFTFDGSNYLKTFIWKIAWDDGTAETFSLPKDKIVAGTSSNSYLFNNQLYRLTLDKNMLDLSVYDLNSGDLTKKYNYKQGESLKIKSGPVYSIYELENRVIVQDESNSERIFKIFSKGIASIYVSDHSSNYLQLTLGAYNPTSTGISVGGVLGSFGSVAGVAISGSQQLTGIRQGSTFFNADLTFPDLKIFPDETGLSTPQRINQFENTRESDILYFKEYYYQDFVHFAYINRNRTFRIVEFQ